MLTLSVPRVGSLLAIGAHPDDIEIAAGGLLLSLARATPGVRVTYLLATGTPDRVAEARSAAAAFLPGAEVTFVLGDLPDTRLPAYWTEVKDLLGSVGGVRPELVLAPAPHDAHQDHRLLAKLTPTVFRDATVLHYEIPKWDGDLGRPSVYVPLTDEIARLKVELLNKHYPSQAGRDWWDDEVFLGLARLRGMECRSRYAEAYWSPKLALAF